MARFDGYNRHDFHYPRTTRDAFGSGFYVDKPKFNLKEWVAYVLFLISVACFVMVF